MTTGAQGQICCTNIILSIGCGDNRVGPVLVRYSCENMWCWTMVILLGSQGARGQRVGAVRGQGPEEDIEVLSHICKYGLDSGRNR